MLARRIVFVHGMFVTYRCWDGWVDRFTKAGYACEAPPWPGRAADVTVDELRRRHPDPVLGRLSLADIVGAYEERIRALPAPPILVGHSMGGLVVQLLLQRGLGSCGVAIDSAPPKGVFVLSWSFLRSNWPVINPFVGKHRPFLMSLAQFRYAFANTRSPEDARAAYDAHVVPESRVVGRGTLGETAAIDFARPRAPLLMIGGANDHIIPAALNRANVRKYGPAAPTDYVEMEGRTHNLILDPGWQDVADAAASWIDRQGARGGGAAAAGAAAPA